MAVTIQEPSAALFYASDDMCYKIGLDDLGPDNEIRKATYQIAIENDVDLQKLKSFRPVSIDDKAEINAKFIARCALGTVIPPLNKAYDLIIDNSFSKNIVIKHGEIVINTDTISSSESIASSPPKTIINAHFTPYEDAHKSDVIVLTDKEDLDINNNVHDWIRIHGSWSGTITFHYNDGAVDVVSRSGESCLMPSGPAQLFPVAEERTQRSSDEIEKYVIKIGERSIIYNVVKPCAKTLDVYFLEPKGSWSVMSFNQNYTEETQRTAATICRGGNCPVSVQDLFNNYGSRTVLSRSWLQVELSDRSLVTDHNLNFFRAFNNARQYRALFPFAQGASAKQLMAPFVINNNSLLNRTNRGLRDISITGFFGLNSYE